MWRDRWFAVGAIGVMLSCVACLTPLAALALGALGLAALAGHLDAILIPIVIVLTGLTIYRYRAACRRRP
jgi:mercuric ion transport protein